MNPRLLLLAVVALGLAPTTWIRTADAPDDRSQALTITRLAITPQQFGALRFLAAWELDSPNSRFGGYSALVSLGNGRLLAISDAGGELEMAEPDRADGAPPRIGQFTGENPGAKWQTDSEAITRDPVSGDLWLAYEGSNFITRFDAQHRRLGFVNPAEMSGWSRNSGPESLVRLRDGRFIVMAERSPARFVTPSPALLFAEDPVRGGRPLQFVFDPQGVGRPTGMAELPDGRVVMLLRDWTLSWPPRFPTRLAVADPAEIAEGGTWTAQVVADLFGAVPSDNYEGIAVVPGADGGATIWIISDDNKASFQRSLLLKFAWKPRNPTS